MSADDPGRDDMAVDQFGNILPMSPQQVRAMVLQMLDDGEIEAIIVRVKETIAVQVFGPPTQELLDIFESVASGMRRVLKGH